MHINHDAATTTNTFFYTCLPDGDEGLNKGLAHPLGRRALDVQVAPTTATTTATATLKKYNIYIYNNK